MFLVIILKQKVKKTTRRNKNKKNFNQELFQINLGFIEL